MTTYESLLEEYSRNNGGKLPKNAEQEILLQPYSFAVRCFTLPDLFAGKMHALVYRAWQRRIKGRDWFDFEWYVRWNVPLDFKHLQARIKEFSGEEVSQEEFMLKLRNKLADKVRFI